MPPRPFEFVVVGDDLVDYANGLRLAGYQWPEYYFTVALEPLDGPQAEAWPLRDRAYYEFSCEFGMAGGERTCAISSAWACQPFERDFPGRSDELLDAIIPLVIGTSLNSFPKKESGTLEIYPKNMHELLRTQRRYSRRDDNPGTPEIREAQSAKSVSLRTGLTRGLRDFFF